MATLEDALLTVYRESLVGNKKTVALENRHLPVRSTAKRKLKQIDFQFDGRELRGLEQNPDTKSRWAKIPRDGKKAMQFLERGKYVAVVANVHLCPHIQEYFPQPLAGREGARWDTACVYCTTILFRGYRRCWYWAGLA